MFVAWSMGRLAALWDEPDAFRPERFLDAAGKFTFPSPSKMPAFLAGPRTCLGKDVAYLGAGLLLSKLVRRFRFELAQAHEPTYDTGLTLWVEGGLLVRFVELEPGAP